MQAVRITSTNDLFLEVQNPGQFYAEFGEYAAGQEAGIERLQVTDMSTEAVFNYLMEQASRPA